MEASGRVPAVPQLLHHAAGAFARCTLSERAGQAMLAALYAPDTLQCAAATAAALLSAACCPSIPLHFAGRPLLLRRLRGGAQAAGGAVSRHSQPPRPAASGPQPAGQRAHAIHRPSLPGAQVRLDGGRPLVPRSSRHSCHAVGNLPGICAPTKPGRAPLSPRCGWRDPCGSPLAEHMAHQPTSCPQLSIPHPALPSRAFIWSVAVPSPALHVSCPASRDIRAFVTLALSDRCARARCASPALHVSCLAKASAAP